MINLDDPQVYKRFDLSDMLSRLHELPEQCREAWQKALSFDLPADYSHVDKVVVLGMGGSAIGGDLLSSLAAPRGVPVFVDRDYDLPAFVNAKSLIIASSYSGMTEETISSFVQALETEAKKLVICTGGRLKELAEGRGVPVFSFDYHAQPRAAFGHSFIPLVGILQKLGLLDDKSEEVKEMVQVLEELSFRINEECPSRVNPAKQLATKLLDRLVVIYGGGILSRVACRWKTQFNENSKAWAFYETLPELSHNAIVGYESPPEMKTRVFVVLLRSNLIHPRTLIRYQVTSELLVKSGIDHEIINAEGTSPLSQMMSLVLFGDYVSYYLAILYKTDPSPVRAIDYLKERLAQVQKEL